MKRAKLLILSMCALLLGVTAATAEIKIAFIDLERTFDEYYRTQEADAKLKELAEEFNTDREEMVSEVEAMREAFNAVRAEALDKALSEEVRTERRAEAEERLMDIRAQEEKIRRFDELRAKQLEEQGQRMRSGLVEEIQAVIRDHARLNGYHAVIDVSGQTLNGIETVLYYDETMEVTADILEELNKDAAAIVE